MQLESYDFINPSEWDLGIEYEQQQPPQKRNNQTYVPPE